MRAARFRATLLAGHKEHALEVPFDPAAKWGIATQAVRAGRRGFAVRATIDGETFDSFAVARARKFWLLLPAPLEKQARIDAGDELTVQLRPTS